MPTHPKLVKQLVGSMETLGDLCGDPSGGTPIPLLTTEKTMAEQEADHCPPTLRALSKCPSQI
jgi:hypothetical protein